MKDLWFGPHIKAAKAGDDVAARALVLCMARYLRWGKVPPADLADYFATAFEQVADGRKADKALNTEGENATFKERYNIAREVWTLSHRAVNRLPLRDNKKKIGAFSIVGDKHRHLSAARVKQIYDDMKGLIEAEFLDDQITNHEACRHFDIDMQIVFGQLAEALKNRVRN